MTDTYTPVSPSGATLIGYMQPWITTDLAMFLDAVGALFDPTASIVQDVGFDGDPDYVSAYGSIFNVETCPTGDLPYLGMFVGASVPIGSSQATARAIVQGESGLQRGTTASIIAAAQRFLTGSQTVTLYERLGPDGSTPDPDWFVLEVDSSEIISASALIAAVNAVKPGGVMWTFNEVSGYTWDDAENEWEADVFSWAASLTTQP